LYSSLFESAKAFVRVFSWYNLVGEIDSRGPGQIVAYGTEQDRLMAAAWRRCSSADEI